MTSPVQPVVMRLIRCCGCGDKVQARLTDGSEIYPHRKDLFIKGSASLIKESMTSVGG